MGVPSVAHLAINIHGFCAAIAGLCAVLRCLLTICCAALGHSYHLQCMGASIVCIPCPASGGTQHMLDLTGEGRHTEGNNAFGVSSPA